MPEVSELAKRAKEAAFTLASLPTAVKNKALYFMADSLVKRQEPILQENQKDIEAGRARNLSSAMLDRLLLNESRIEGMAESLRDVASLPDPVGEVVKGWRLPNGLLITQVRTPMGVIAMIYEARPNVTVDAAGLCLKSGNAVLMRGGSEAINSNIALAEVLSQAAISAGIPEGAIQLVKTTEHEVVQEMLKLREYIDLVIPRGGEGLIKTVAENATMPVIKHFKGICHVYVDEMADLEMAVRIVDNAKTQRPSVCNAVETVLVHAKVASKYLPELAKVLTGKGVELRGDSKTRKVLPQAKEATEEDWSTEYLDLILSIKVVETLEEAIDHIRTYSTGLAEAIITEDYTAARKFLDEVDSAAVYVNASTRLTDGAEFGLGSEIGITTDKVFPRGPMGLEALTSTKYVAYGTGQIRQ
ncbi:MAG TPA: glutamate-5-semialdehyde dehydrogenase [Candidatus Subteraquimicrobiales bacterium]